MDQQSLDGLLQQFVTKALSVMEPYVGDRKSTTMYFQPSPHLVDGHVVVRRKGGGFLGMSRPRPDAPPEAVEIASVAMPGVISDAAAGLTVVVLCSSSPYRVFGLTHWREDGGTTQLAHEEFAQFHSLFMAQLDQPLVAQKPPKVAPGKLF